MNIIAVVCENCGMEFRFEPTRWLKKYGAREVECIACHAPLNMGLVHFAADQAEVEAVPEPKPKGTCGTCRYRANLRNGWPCMECLCPDSNGLHPYWELERRKV